MKQYLKPKYIVLGLVIITFCFVPVVDMEYLVVVERQVLEPYTVQEEVQEPYIYQRDTFPRRDAGGYYPDAPQQNQIVMFRTVIKEVTKTRLVTRPVAETRTKRVSILRYLLR